MKTKIKLDKNVTVLIESKKTNYGIELLYISLAVTELREYGPKTHRLRIEGQWYDDKEKTDRNVIALKMPTALYFRGQFEDSFEIEMEVFSRYKKFCEKNADIMSLIKCEKEAFMLFLKRSFDVNEVYNNETFCSIGLNHKN